MEREKNISKDEWAVMLDNAGDQFLREGLGVGPARSFKELTELDPIAADELGGAIERMLGKALGWTTYESRPDDLPELPLSVQLGRGGEFLNTDV
jgi:hypothetical protein